ncbi:DUF4412 domain-containing protein [Aliifodinibius sp. S!AR15-10]|uniref:DUF4412 domain-containing protein n=1 Tax=Aliifodinibius sp. S!AR15-10 TaxID=2950437 RepID=UPI00285481EF|nr:DUF4412 domain-containing protein [Aliifodinibius sp. S!AR15-10]MDR8390875.1 DUF4412 domain-containing protein [Aliifodinibius sp. S!AR15-10]
MKCLNVLLAGVLISIACNLEANAQIFDRLKKKAQQAAEQKLEEKMAEQVAQAAQQMVEKSWNSIFGEMSGDSLSGTYPFAMNSNVKTEDLYRFDTITTMQIETTRKNGKSDPPVLMDMHYNQNEMYTGTSFRSEEMNNEDGELFIIYDLKNSAMLMLMSNEEDKFSFNYEWKQDTEMSGESAAYQETDWDNINEWQGYTKIGSRNIHGYACDGYRSESDEGLVELWVTRDTFLGTDLMLFKAQTNAKQMKGKIPEDYPYGTIMEMVSEDKTSGDKTTMKMININQEANIQYKMADYPSMSFTAKAMEE